MHNLIRILFHPFLIVSQPAERSLELLKFTDFVRIVRLACTTLVLGGLSTVLLRVKHGNPSSHQFSVIGRTESQRVVRLSMIGNARQALCATSLERAG
jgi:hypothetical protein